MNIPKGLKYTRSHEWVEFLEGGGARIGITDFAQDALGGIVFINLPQVGDTVTLEDSVGDVESVKTVSDVFSPVAGVVTAVNEALEDTPELLNDDPYGAWIAEVGELGGQKELLTPKEYDAFCKEEG